MAPIDGSCDKCGFPQYNLVPYWERNDIDNTQWLCSPCFAKRPLRPSIKAKTWKSLFQPSYGFEYRRHGRSRDIILDVYKYHFMITISW